MELIEYSWQHTDTLTDTFLHFHSNSNGVSFPQSLITTPFLPDELCNRLFECTLRHCSRRGLMHFFICTLIRLFWAACVLGTIKSGALDSVPERGIGKECVSVFNCLQWHFFWLLPSLLISTFGCNYKYCHKTLPSVPCPSKPLMLVCLLNDDHYIFPPFQSHCNGRQSKPKSHARVPSIDYT